MNKQSKKSKKHAYLLIASIAISVVLVAASMEVYARHFRENIIVRLYEDEQELDKYRLPLHGEGIGFERSAVYDAIGKIERDEFVIEFEIIWASRKTMCAIVASYELRYEAGRASWAELHMDGARTELGDKVFSDYEEFADFFVFWFEGNVQRFRRFVNGC